MSPLLRYGPVFSPYVCMYVVSHVILFFVVNASTNKIAQLCSFCCKCEYKKNRIGEYCKPGTCVYRKKDYKCGIFWVLVFATKKNLHKIRFVLVLANTPKNKTHEIRFFLNSCFQRKKKLLAFATN